MKKPNVLIYLIIVLCAVLRVDAQKKLLSTVPTADATFFNVAADDKILYFPGDGGVDTINIESNLNYTAVSNKTWCTAKVITQGTKKGLELTVKATTSTISRTALVSLKVKDGYSCKISVNQTGKTSEADYINIASDSKLGFEYFSESKTVIVFTNVSKENFSVTSSQSWAGCKIVDTEEENKKEIIVSVETNGGSTKRTADITLSGSGITKTVSVSQNGRELSTGVLDDEKDIYIRPAKSSASSVNGTSTLDRTYDNDMTTLYHSQYGNTNRFPITLTYEFENVSEMDYFIYYPRVSGINGNFKEIEVYAATKQEPIFKKIGKKVDFKGSNSPSKFVFPETLINPTKIQIKVLSGTGDNNGVGFASCAEMEFYRINPLKFDYATVFTDPSCSELKQGITQTDIQNISSEFFKELATEMYKGDYNTEFRTQSYKSWQHPSIMAEINKTNTYGLRDNPTGIYAEQDEVVVVIAGETHGQSVGLFLQNPDGGIGGTQFALNTGVNTIKAPFAGLFYVMYYTETGTEPAINVNFVTGQVNGYFDRSRHKKADWSRLINGAGFRHFDMKGNYATMTFETAAYRSYVPDGEALIKQYDLLVSDEQEFMGLKKYPDRQYKNRAHFQVVYGDNFMYSGGNHTGYNAYTQKDILSVDKLTAKDMSYSETSWGPAHELGHTHQARPGLRWQGMAEVTNNIHSAYIQTKWTGKCRLQEEKLSTGKTRYEKAFAEIIDAKIAHNAHTDPFCRLVPFWQLKLYIHDVLGQTDFYPDLYEKIRTLPNLGHGECQMQFTKLACEISGLDLTDFFTAWGFFTPIDVSINDYGVAQFTVTQKMIDETLAEIKAMKYPKPKDFTRITDNTKNSYK